MTMKKEDITLILEVQQKAYKDATEILFGSLNSRIDEQTKIIQDLKRSLEFTQSEIDELKNNYGRLEGDGKIMKETIQEQKAMIKGLQDKLDAQEDYSRKRNIRVDGVTDNSTENSEQTQSKVDKIIKEKLGLSNVKIDIAHRIPNKNSNSISPRTIIAKLNNELDREAVMKTTRKLKQTGIFINEDYCENTLNIRRELYPQLKAARESGNIAYIRRRSLIIKGKFSRPLNQQVTVLQSPHTPQRETSSMHINITPKSCHPPPSPLLLPRPIPQNQQNRPVGTSPSTGQDEKRKKNQRDK